MTTIREFFLREGAAGWRLKLALFALAGFWIGLSYYVPQLIDSGERHVMVPFAWERGIPFQPWWTLVYQSIFVVLPAFYLLLEKRRDVLALAFGLMGTALIDGILFTLFPTFIVRPELPDGVDGFLYQWLIVKLDGPVNLIPSQHAAMAMIACMAGFRLPRYPWLKPASVLWLGLLLYSTLAVKQHVAFDLLPGCVVGALTFWLAGWLLEKAKAARPGFVLEPAVVPVENERD